MAVPANWRLINIDLLDPDSSANFDTSTLAPASQEGTLSHNDVQSLGTQIRQMLRGGDAEGALRGALGVVGGVYGGDVGVKVWYYHFLQGADGFICLISKLVYSIGCKFSNFCTWHCCASFRFPTFSGRGCGGL